MKITKNVSRTYQVSTIWPYGKYGAFVEQRKKAFGGDGKMKDLSKCFKCGHEFAEDDDVNAAFLKGHKNVFICNNCVEKLRQEENNDIGNSCADDNEVQFHDA